VLGRADTVFQCDHARGRCAPSREPRHQGCQSLVECTTARDRNTVWSSTDTFVMHVMRAREVCGMSHEACRPGHQLWGTRCTHKRSNGQAHCTHAPGSSVLKCTTSRLLLSRYQSSSTVVHTHQGPLSHTLAMGASSAVKCTISRHLLSRGCTILLLVELQPSTQAVKPTHLPKHVLPLQH
jgi:hypothetical protein